MRCMYIDFSSLFHQSSKDRSGQGRVRIPLDTAKYPPEWNSLSYKTYPRLEKKPLDPLQRSEGVFKTISTRRSSHNFSRRQLTLAEISAVLKYSGGIVHATKGEAHRAQPSGGALYPIEMYPIVFSGSSEIPAAVYHYNVKDHALDVLWERAFTKEYLSTLFTYPWAQDASLAIVLTGVFDRNQIKYGERGYRQILIEAGAIMQNVYLVAQELGLQCTAIDGVNEPNIEKLLDIDGVSESALCSILIG